MGVTTVCCPLSKDKQTDKLKNFQVASILDLLKETPWGLNIQYQLKIENYSSSLDIYNYSFAKQDFLCVFLAQLLIKLLCLCLFVINSLSYPGREGTLDCKLHWYRNFYRHDLSCIVLITLGTFNKSRLGFTKCPNYSNDDFNLKTG